MMTTKEKNMKLTVIDGQGGKMGKSVIEQLKKQHPDLEIYAIDTSILIQMKEVFHLLSMHKVHYSHIYMSGQLSVHAQL